MYRFLLFAFVCFFVLSAAPLAHDAAAVRVVDYEVQGGMVRYAYADKEAPPLLSENEISSLRTPSSYTEYLGTNEYGEAEYRVRFFPTPQYVYDNNTWWTISYDATSTAAFARMRDGSLLARVLRAVAPPAYADTIFSGTGDDATGAGGSPFSSVRSASSGDSVWSSVVSNLSFTASSDEDGEYFIWRAYLPFDTGSVIPSEATITAATLNAYVDSKINTDNDGTDYLTVIRTSQATHTSITTADYDNVGTTEGIDTGQRKDITSVSTSAYLSFTLNATGLSWIAKAGEASSCSSTAGWSCFGLREGHDMENNAPTNGTGNGVTFSSSQVTGTSQDPYLDVTYTVPSSTSTLVRPPNNLGLVGYWSFNEATTTIAGDFSGNQNIGSFSGIATPPTSTSGWTHGKRGGGLRLDATNDAVNIAHSTSLNLSSAMTITAWVRPNTLAAGFRGLVGKGAGSNLQYALSLDTGGINFNFINGGGLREFFVTTGLVVGEWAHVAATYDDAGNNITLYINGVDVGGSDGGSGAETQSILTGTDGVVIGEMVDGEECNCTVDEVRIYNRVLGASEIQHLAGVPPGASGAVRVNASSVTLTNGTTLGSGAGLAGHWTFDGGDVRWTSETAGTAYDRSGNNNHGTFTDMSRLVSTAIGNLGQGVFLDATDDDIVASGSGSLDITSALTIALWMKVNSVSGLHNLVGKGDEPSDALQYALNLTNDELNFSVCYGTSASCNSDTTLATSNSLTANFLTNTWYHVAVTYNDAANAVVLYKNGMEIANDTSNAISVSIQSSSHPVIIGELGEGQATDGTLDDVRIYNRSLTPVEILQLYRLGQVKIVQ